MALPALPAAARILILLEGVALLLLGVALAGLTLSERPERLEAALFEVLVALGVGALLVLAAGRVATSIHWRSPVLLLNLIAIPVSVSLAQSDQWWLAVPVGAVAVSVLVLLARRQALP